MRARRRRDWLVGRSHECDFPPQVAVLPVLTAPKFKLKGTSAQIDARVREIVRDSLSVYCVDTEALKTLEPNVIVTQDHCEVCAVSLADVEAATCTWIDRAARIISLRPDSLADVYADIRRVAGGLDAEQAGEDLVRQIEERLGAVSARVAGPVPARVAFIEWVEPLMAGGNWMPELVKIAGGHSLFGEAGKHSGWMQWEELAAVDPDLIIVAPCGYGLERCLQELPLLQAKPGWSELGAVRSGRVYFADGNAYFNRPGPRLADTAEMLAEMLHPTIVGERHQGTTWVRPLHRRLQHVAPHVRARRDSHGLSGVDDLRAVPEAKRKNKAHGLGFDHQVHLGEIERQLVVSLRRGAGPGEEVRMIKRTVRVVGVKTVDRAAQDDGPARVGRGGLVASGRADAEC